MINFNFQDFRFINDEYKMAYGCFQFKYKGYEISASNMGVDKGACATKVAIFSGNDMIGEFDTIEEAIDSINK